MNSYFTGNRNFGMPRKNSGLLYIALEMLLLQRIRVAIIRHMNPAAEKLTGWREPEASGRQFDEVISIIKQETVGEIIDNPVDRVLKDGFVADHNDYTVLLAKDGRADSGQ